MILLALGCVTETYHPPEGVMVVVQESHTSWLRNFNPLISSSRWPSTAGVYEPLLIFNPMQGSYTPWLAETYAWDADGAGLTFHLQDGVKWSDGSEFSADDVVFTFRLLKEKPALDIGGVWSFMESISAPDSETVAVRFSRPFSPGLARLAHQPIVPEHIWADIEDPITFTNPEPVGTGPFTEVTLFESQVFELSANPHYWQEGKPAVKALRFPAIPTNDQAALALINGEVDWAGKFVPAIDRIFVEANPEHHKYWFPQVGGSIFLYANTTTPPLDDPGIRKAISRAIDRDLIVQVAAYGYTTPAGPTALSDGYADWRIPVAEADDWTRYDPEAAAAALEAAGYVLGEDGLRRRDGETLVMNINVVSGWSDWVRAGQVIARNLRSIGVDASLKTYDFGAWFEQLGRGEFTLSLGWSGEGPTPYAMYGGLMSAEGMVPVGEIAPSNWHRYASSQADALLRAFEQTTDPAEQHRLIAQLQAEFVAQAPAIPLFLNPSWGQCSTARFTGFPSAEDPYARLSPNNPPETLLVMTRVMPR
ncbi:MAG: peptide/nickel transport system substrate-binding protein [Myxococcota bacterium]|jgi:peptide/nickel transport system substrate-binding protein